MTLACHTAAALREKKRRELEDFATAQERRRNAEKEEKLRAYYEAQLQQADADIRLAQLSLESTVASRVSLKFEQKLEKEVASYLTPDVWHDFAPLCAVDLTAFSVALCRPRKSGTRSSGC
jgi:hypothetical protein